MLPALQEMGQDDREKQLPAIMNCIHRYLTLMVSLCCVASGFAQTIVSPDEAKEVFALLEQLAPQQSLQRYRGLLEKPDSARDKQELEFARKEVAKAYDIVPKLRKLLKVGASVFDYRSLLAHGDITYQVIKSSGGSSGGDPFSSNSSEGKVEYGYRLYIGLPAGEFPHPWDFQVLFDSKGVISAIKGVDWKK